MTHQNNYTYSEDLVEKGLEAVPEMMRVLINQAMQVELSQYLQGVCVSHTTHSMHLTLRTIPFH
jgi:hypothetical protein